MSKENDKSEIDDVDPYGLPRIPLRGYYDVKRCDERRRWVEKFTSTNLRHVGEWWADEGKEDSCSTTKLKGNAENVIGLAKIPIGVAGPLLIHGDHVSGHVLCPFATTEGALIASATRGATALSRAGGVMVQVGKQRMLRAPAFMMRSIRETRVLSDWFRENLRHLKQQVSLYSQHCVLVELVPFHFGKTIVIQFVYETGDAAGQNMTTSATWHACKWALTKLQEELPGVKVVKFYIDTNVSGDKKMAAVHLQNTRGWFVQAEAWIPEHILQSVLKIDSKTLLQAHHLIQEGATRIGTIGSNINVANVMTSVFIATGQDVANVVESASAQLHVSAISKKELDEVQKKILHYNNGKVLDGDKTDEGGVYFSMQLPSIIAATVGGGTTLATQKECLQIMGCHGKGVVRRFVEIIASFALALDISTLASVASGHFASAHERLGRNRPEHGLREVHLNKEFFGKVVGSRGTLVNWKPFKVDAGTSIISELTKTEISKKVGHFGYIVHCTTSSGEVVEWPVVIKSKPLDSETATMINKIAQACGLELAVQYERHKLDTGFRLCHIRELAIVQMEEPEIKQLMPEIYYSISSISKDMFVYVMEYLSDEHFTHLNTADDISGWTTADIKVVLRDMAKFHALFMDKLAWLKDQSWMDHAHSHRVAVKLRPLWKAMLANATREFPMIWTSKVIEMTTQAIDSADAMWKIFDSFPQTLIHNDCNPRNICIRKATPTAGSHDDPRRMCIYDWELARIDVPQHDLAEFLAFVLQPDTSLHKRMELIEYYITMLEKYSKQKFNHWKFLQVLDAAALDFQLNRLNMYTMAHTFKDYKFLARVVRSNSTYLLQRKSDGHLKFITMAAKL